jgi:hypothetical protein
MKNHSRSGMKRGKLGYRTPSRLRFESHAKARTEQAKFYDKWNKKSG